MLMKACSLLVMLSVGTAVVEQDRTITKVVKLLQDMLDRSVKEGDEERVIYAKFKCYCDTSEAEKRASIKSLTEQIELLENKIAETQGATGELSEECADLKDRMAKNKMAQDEATAVREKENKAFLAEEEDLTEAIKSLKEAIKVLGEVGADQTKSVGADHEQFMAGHKAASFLGLNSNAQHALNVAMDFMNQAQYKKATAFLQAPFTGTYTSQSAEIMGILKNMRDTFIKNLAEARATEKKQLDAYNAFMKISQEAYKAMATSFEAKQKELGGNDESLALDRKSLATAKGQKANDEEFLEKLLPLCAEKAKGYETRKVLRAAEEAAIAEAISILNSDNSFATFGKASATSTGSLKFVQLRSVQNGDAKVRSEAKNALEQAAKDAHSARLSKVVALLQAENPFETVLDEIDKMLALIEEEGKVDKENLDWCNSEREENHKDLKEKKSQILSLNKEINRLTDKIENPKTGLKAIIAETEESLVKNDETQKTETASRLEENIAYQKDIKNLVQAESILEKAVKVLKAYYDDLAAKLEAGEAFLQRKEDPTPPEAWKGDGAYEGQSGDGNKVIEMLEFILKSAVDEEHEAHSDEQTAQMSYEESMTELKAEQAKLERLLAKTQEDLAETQKELLDTEEDLKKTTADKEAIEAYLAKIKPGCDFITANFELREENRGIETEALKKAIRLIKGTPAYKTFKVEEKVESYGDCKEKCVGRAAHVECKACMADVTIPAYCAGHEGTTGC